MISLDLLKENLPWILKLGAEVITIVFALARFLEKRFLKMLGEHFYARSEGDRLAKKVARISTELGLESEQAPTSVN